MKPDVDYSLYLVTDSTPAILGARHLVEVVDQALTGGVTIVQYRDKTSDTGDLIQTAKALHAKCKQHKIPLLINDRVDVALAVGCEGVHLGQDDMNIATARSLLGPDAIIGATVSSIDEARIAVERGADYLGIGTLYATSTKKNTKDIIGINGIRAILRALSQGDEAAKSVKTVCIGGVNASNVQLVKHQLQAPTPTTPSPKTIDGVAIVSAIIGAEDPKSASEKLSHLFHSPPPFSSQGIPLWLEKAEDELSSLKASTNKALKNVHAKTPLSHNMTNTVVQSLAANVALSIGASPIMSFNGAEAPDLAALAGGLVVNMGTATPDAVHNQRTAIRAYNAVGGPVVLDPVGAGATQVRREALAFLLQSGYFDLVKGNEREILAVARASGFEVGGEGGPQRGVDSGDALFGLAQRADIVRQVAARERNVVLMTGAVDVLSDGVRTYSVQNGSKYLGMITGSGCTLGTTLAAYLAANREEGGGDKLRAALAGILHFEVAAETAAERDDVKGPGTFVPAFLDELYNRRMDIVEGREWWDYVKVGIMKDVTDTGILKL
ncbi:TMP-TENI-domain-containing protein [Corynespora cassiicola Philippines]|uniref:TMP-TENI-domain-containing protein n=1 Tax=Corynespora cassiicola Philippines TaxID=1448308 RepID=A0A2T2P916_CORCC|nr:TMP-TENI-domain-containing protein [Corynespora cassiicola Philippines]